MEVLIQIACFYKTKQNILSNTTKVDLKWFNSITQHYVIFAEVEMLVKNAFRITFT